MFNSIKSFFKDRMSGLVIYAVLMSLFAGVPYFAFGVTAAAIGMITLFILTGLAVKYGPKSN